MKTRQTLSSQDLRRRAEEVFRAGESIIPGISTPGETEKILYELRVHQIQLEMQNEELRRAQEELDASQARYFDLYDLAPVGYLTLSEKRLIREVNLAAANMFNAARSSLVKEPVNRILSKEDQYLFYQHLKECLTSGMPEDWDMRLIRSDGSLFWAHLQAVPATDGEFWITLNDISGRKQAEAENLALQQQLQHSQKLESLGVLAGGIAHDFNNILAIIMGYCGLTRMDYDTAEKHIPIIEKAVERAAGLCQQMLAYAGKTTLSRTLVVIWPLVDDVVDMLRATIRQNVVIRTKYSPDILSVAGDASQLRQIVMNLIINASEAIGEAQGEVCVSLSSREIAVGQKERDHLGMVIPPGGYLCLEVTDNGCGMDDETRRRIFEPFYTTKFTGRGLGMSAVLGILKAHNGALQLFSQPGQGTTFKVYLPTQIADSVFQESFQHVPAPWKGSGTILLVDDEVQVVLIVKTMLTSLGFSVIEASNGKEALDIYRKNSTTITLVITDVGMPVMDGYELFHELKKLNPKLPIIISSGYGETEVNSRITREDIAGVVSKPYNFDQLRDVLRCAIEAHG